MSKLKCPACGAKVREDDVRCEDCGIYLKNDRMNELDDVVKRDNLSESEKVNQNEGLLNDVDTESLEHRTYNNIDKLSFVAGFLKVVWCLVGILLVVTAIVNNAVILILYSIPIFITIPFVALPITWMQLMLENLYEIKNKLK